MAELASQQGSAFYKDGKLDKAQELFQAAVDLAQNIPKYSSNLSAAQYEAGKYSDSISSIAKSWALLRTKSTERGDEILLEDEPLAIKLATRFAKACIHIYHTNEEITNCEAVDISATNQKGIARDIERFGCKNGADPKIQEMKCAWEQWRAIRDSDCGDRTDAKARLMTIPIFKSRADPTLEYYTFGHDEVQSYMGGINNTDEYSLDSPQYEGREDWSFLFGGSGDARHVFGTIIHLADMADEPGTLEPIDGCQMHMTLIDIHPASLARVIMVMSLVRRILATRLNNDNSKRIELYATLFYMYGTLLMPDYCHRIVMDTARALVDELSQDRNSLSKCLHINKNSIPAILEVLEYWSKPLPKSTSVFLQNRKGSNPQSEMMDNFMTSFMGVNPNNPEAKLATISKKNREKGGDIYNDPVAERKMFNETMVLVPPKPLLSRHPVLEKLVNSYTSASGNMYEAVRKEVETTWKPNPTIFDCRSTEHPLFGAMPGYPLFNSDAYHCITPFFNFIKEFQRGKPPSFCKGNTAFAITTQFFELVANSMWVLQNTLKVEVIVSDVLTGTTKLFAGELGERPKDFPNRFTRMWLSNVPDYTHGILNTAVHLTPYLEPEGLVMANCLLNTGSWSTLADFCYNYTLLLPHDIPRFLGCKVIKPDGTCWDDNILQKMELPRSLSELASKNELHAWLSHLLVCTLCSGTPEAPPRKIEMPNNLGAFLHVLIRLCHVGFPSHWIGDFLQSVIDDKLITSAVPYTGILPIPTSHAYNRKAARKINLAPWKADLEVILALTKDALPFAVNIPKSLVEDIKTYSAKVDPVRLEFSLRGRQWGPLISPFCPMMGIIFFNGMGIGDIPEFLPQILEGQSLQVPSSDLQVMLSTEVDLSKRVVTWKMSKSWYEKMRQQKWRMAAYRTDLKVLATAPVDSERWSLIA